MMSLGKALGVSIVAEAKLSAGGASVETISLWPSFPLWYRRAWPLVTLGLGMGKTHAINATSSEG